MALGVQILKHFRVGMARLAEPVSLFFWSKPDKLDINRHYHGFPLIMHHLKTLQHTRVKQMKTNAVLLELAEVANA